MFYCLRANSIVFVITPKILELASDTELKETEQPFLFQKKLLEIFDESWK